MGFFDDIVGDDFLGDLGDGFFGTDYQKDYSHAAKLMLPDAHALTPQYKFLFHVYFNLNVPGPSDDKGLIGALVKTIQLPSFDLKTEELVQYNRKRLIHNRIEYDSVDVTFHDDSSDTVRSLWINYYNYYFSDSRYPYGDQGGVNDGPTAPIGYNKRDVYEPSRTRNDWGMSTSSPNGIEKQAYFKDIVIYGFSRKRYVSYTLVNPMITNWSHDKYDYSAVNGTMEHTMKVKYEAVKYDSGIVNPTNVKGFANPARYDTSPSPLSKPGSTASIFGQSGALDTGAGIIDDLTNGNIFGAIKKGGTFGKTIKNSDLNFGQILKTDVLNEAKIQLPTVLKGVLPKPGGIFPKAKSKNGGLFGSLSGLFGGKDGDSEKGKVLKGPNGPRKPTPYSTVDPDGSRAEAITAAIEARDAAKRAQ